MVFTALLLLSISVKKQIFVTFNFERYTVLASPARGADGGHEFGGKIPHPVDVRMLCRLLVIHALVGTELGRILCFYLLN